MRNWIIVSVVLLFYGPALTAQETPARAATCAACHGAAGVSSNPQWPSLAGQKAGYLATQIRAFRDGDRVNALMAPMMVGITDKDIVDLASYYATQTSATAASGNPDLVAAGENLAAYCKACHGMQGKPVAQTWPNLAGQQAAYLQQQLSAFKHGERVNAHMQTVLSPFGEAEFAALAAYYSQLSP